MPLRPASPQPRPALLARWLLVIAALVFAMVVVGGITRLTESGLSIVRWAPVSGIVPPLTAEDWSAEFEAYRQTPEYRQVNTGMTESEFRGIYFWEYVHRLLGRVIGLVFAAVLAWAWLRRAVPPGFGWRLAGLFALGGLQGAIGWWMVYSGLIDRPDVSHVRLAIHLANALLILALLLWVALDLFALAQREPPRGRVPLLGVSTLGLLGIQIILGAFTAGLDAGFAFAEWPTMGGQFFPEGVPFLEPAWRNLIDQPIVVQFTHRWTAWLVAAAVAAVAWRSWKRGAPGHALGIVVLVSLQIVLGISTLLSGVLLPVAVAHQAGAVLLLAGLVATVHRLAGQRP
jgi:heme a synthase